MRGQNLQRTLVTVREESRWSKPGDLGDDANWLVSGLSRTMALRHSALNFPVIWPMLEMQTSLSA